MQVWLKPYPNANVIICNKLNIILVSYALACFKLPFYSRKNTKRKKKM